MKSYCYIISLMALASFVSCAEKMEDTGGPAESQRHEMTFVTEADGTRTTLESDGRVFWEQDDKISIFDGNANEPFSIKECSCASAVFAGMAADSDVYYALYPYSGDNAFSDGKITVELQDNQPATEGGFGSGYNISAAASTDGTLMFRNLLGLVRFNLTEVPEGRTLSSITLQGRNGEAISGTMTVDVADFTSTVSGGCSVTLSAESITPGTYCFAVHPASLSDGIILSFTYSDGSVSRKSGTQPLEIKPGRIETIGEISAPAPDEDGSAEHPFKLCSAEDLMSMKELIASFDFTSSDIHFRLMSDIDMNGVSWTPLYAPDDGFPDSGYPVIYFDGGGYAISNLNVSGKHASFFGVFLGKCTDVTFKDAVVVSDDASPAGVVASALVSYDRSEKSMFENVKAEGGSVKAAYGYSMAAEGSWNKPAYAAGGLCGVMRQGSIVRNCSSSVKVDGTIVGGIAGAAQDGGEISGSSFSGELYAHGDAYDVYAGGIAGYTAGSGSENRMWIKNCSTEGKIDAKDLGHSAGGIVGRTGNDTWIEYSYSKATVEARLNAGGIAGNVECWGCTIFNCVAWNDRYNTEPYECDIQYGIGHVTGFVKGGWFDIHDCYANQTVGLSWKNPSSGATETITLSDEDRSPISTDGTEVTRNRYCGHAADTFEAALAAAGINVAE